MSKHVNSARSVRLLLFIGMLCVFLCSCNTAPTANLDTSTAFFSSNCGISATADFGLIIPDKFHTLSITVSNISDKTITAAAFYVLAYDIHGNILPAWTAQPQITTTEEIAPGAAIQLCRRYHKLNVATVKVYICHTWYDDGTQWGNPDAPLPLLLQSAIPVPVCEKP